MATAQRKIYRGWRDREGQHLTHVLVNGHPLCHIHKHSSEMTWGYSGSGPADLALSILTDYLGDEERAFQLHQQFKRHFVAGFDTSSWTLDSEQIENWLKQPTS
jgi:hypothetical protein